MNADQMRTHPPPGLSLGQVTWLAPVAVQFNAGRSALLYGQEVGLAVRGSPEEMLRRFRELSEAEPELIRDAAQHWGPLGLDDYSKPVPDLSLKVVSERIDHWRLWARRVHAVLNFADALRAGRARDPDDRRVLTEWPPKRSWPPVSKNSDEYRNARRDWRKRVEMHGLVAIEQEADDRVLARLEREMPGLMEKKEGEIAQVAEAERWVTPEGQVDTTARPDWVTPEERAAWESEVFRDGKGIAFAPVETADEIPQWAIPSRNDRLNLTFYVNELLSLGRVVPEIQWSEENEPSFTLSGTGFFAAIAIATAAAVTAGQAPSARFLICRGCESRSVAPGKYRYCEDCTTDQARWKRSQRRRRQTQT
jgi:hypothetical protein